jgi:hypothetical protein
MAADHIAEDDLELYALERLAKGSLAEAGAPHPPASESVLSIFDGLSDSLGDRRWRFIEGEHYRPFEALRPGDQYTDAAPERVRGNPAFIWLSYVLPGCLNGRLDALPPGSGDPFAVEDGQRHRSSTSPTDGRRNALCIGHRCHGSGYQHPEWRLTTSPKTTSNSTRCRRGDSSAWRA